MAHSLAEKQTKNYKLLIIELNVCNYFLKKISDPPRLPNTGPHLQVKIVWRHLG